MLALPTRKPPYPNCKNRLSQQTETNLQPCVCQRPGLHLPSGAGGFHRWDKA